MPLYEYRCDACGHRFETIQKFSDPPVEKCPVCGGRVQKLQSAPAFQFKGSGWYVTDYARKDGGTSGDGGATSKPEGSSGDKSEKTDKTEKTEKAKAEKPDTARTGASSTSSSSSAAATESTTK
jgi:putative FmdB family regulatory protein